MTCTIKGNIQYNTQIDNKENSINHRDQSEVTISKNNSSYYVWHKSAQLICYKGHICDCFLLYIHQVWSQYTHNDKDHSIFVAVSWLSLLSSVLTKTFATPYQSIFWTIQILYMVWFYRMSPFDRRYSILFYAISSIQLEFVIWII